MWIVIIASIGVSLLYVVAPPYWEIRAGSQFEQSIEILWACYVYVLPGIIGAVVAIFMSGRFGERLTKLILVLALPIVVAFLWSGGAGSELGSFRVSMMFLAVIGTIYAIAGCIAALIASATKRHIATK
jgi:hypothetical protein